MRIHSVYKGKIWAVRTLVSALVLLFAVVIPVSISQAASSPSLSKSSKDILIGSSYQLKVTNKIAKSTYSWSTGNKSVASVNKQGKVTGNKKGTTYIYCTMKAPRKTYRLSCKVTVIMPAMGIRITNKVSALNVGQIYTPAKSLVPNTSNDKVSWTSSNSSIIKIDSSGRLVALKTGTSAITAKSLSGVKSTMTVKVVDKNGTVTSQSTLNSLLGSGVNKITIQTSKLLNFYIPIGTFTNTKLVVNAPKSEVVNYGKFSSIDLNQIASNTWFENATGNQMNVYSSDSRVVVGEDAKVKITLNASNATTRVVNNGLIQDLVLVSGANLSVSGESKTKIPIKANVAGINVTSSVPLNLNCTKKIKLVLLPGAESSSIQALSDAVVPQVTSNSIVKVTVGTGGNVKVVTINPGDGNDPGDTPPGTLKKIFQLDCPITDITAINVSYLGKAYMISSSALSLLTHMLEKDPSFVSFWKDTKDTTMTYDGQSFRIYGTEGSSTKTVSFTGGQFDGKVFTITMNTDGSVKILSNLTGAAFTFSKGSDDRTLIVSGEASRLSQFTFTILVGSTYTLEKSYKEMKSINIIYGNSTYEVNKDIIDQLAHFIDGESLYLTVWKDTTNTTKTYNGQTVKVTGKAGSMTKTVSFSGGQLNGKSYTVTVNTDHSVTVTSNGSGLTFNISKGTDEKSLTITGTPKGLIFAPTF